MDEHMERAVEVIADYRERSAQVCDFLENAGVALEFHQLPAGDYLVDNRCLFERKAFLDFVESIKDGRLFGQARRMLATPHKVVFILEGAQRDAHKTKMSREAIQGAIISLTVIYGIPLLRSLDQEETARLMLYTSHQLHRLSRGIIKRHGYRPKGRQKQQLYILQGLPGVGKDKAMRLLDEFGSVENIIMADLDELAAVRGIGPVIAGKIRNAVMEETM
ncbi:MAG: nuclease [Verrucomicrobiae bacterium]|nr:nuclease [Verrucomicrobiae bacterium]